MCGALGVMPNSIVPAMSASHTTLNICNLDFCYSWVEDSGVSFYRCFIDIYQYRSFKKTLSVNGCGCVITLHLAREATKPAGTLEP